MTEIPPAVDDEHAFRLLLEDWVYDDGTVSSAAFRSSRGISLFVKERLPNGNGDLLHVGKFEKHGRASLEVGLLRATKRSVNGVEEHIGYDLKMTGSAEPPLEEFRDAHADLQGPLKSKGAASALAAAFNEHGTLERRPQP